MKILMASDVYKPVVNGVSFSIETFLQELQKLGHETALLCPQIPGALPEQGVFRLSSLVFPFHAEQRVALPFPRKILREAWARKWDLIHIHTPFNLGFLGLRMAREKKIPAIFTYHTLFEEYVHYIPLPQASMKLVARTWSRVFCNACRMIIAPSEAIVEKLTEYGVTQPMKVLPTPINPEAFEPISPNSPYAGFPTGSKICLYVGRIAKEKNLEFLLRAFKQMAAAVPAARLVIAGDGPFRPALESMAANLGLGESVRFAGYVPRKELGTWFSKADLFLFSSTTETQGMSLAEALLFGLPAVIVDGPGTREMIMEGENGFITPNDETAFAEKARLLLDNPSLRAALSEKAPASVEKLKPERIVKALVEIYASEEMTWKRK